MTTKREARRLLMREFPDAVESLDEEQVRDDNGAKAWSFVTHLTCGAEAPDKCLGHVGYIHGDGRIEGPY